MYCSYMLLLPKLPEKFMKNQINFYKKGEGGKCRKLKGINRESKEWEKNAPSKGSGKFIKPIFTKSRGMKV